MTLSENQHKFSRLFLITDQALSNRPLLDVVSDACRAGVSLVQLREKTLDGKSLYALASALRGITLMHGARLFINDRLDVALAVNADGVVLPETSFPVQVVKHINPMLLVGRSVHDLDGAIDAQRCGADFLIVGHIFKTASKPKQPPRGLHLLKDISTHIHIPIFAVGGITPANARQCVQNGAFGVAAISSLMQSADISETVRAFQDAIAFVNTA
jgi:thiamine-phosphate pyrophosphorylase